MNTPITAVANSGAELPAAINVAPATSSWSFKTTNESKTSRHTKEIIVRSTNNKNQIYAKSHIVLLAG